MDQPNGQRAPGALLAAVEPDGIAAQIGLAPGDRLVAVDGVALEDILDYQFRTFPDEIVLSVVRPSGQEWEIAVEKDEGEPLGIVLADEIFGPARDCANHCPFCFVRQLPQGLRAPLYFRDDDLRLSVLHGNFITLTNLSEADWQRITEQRLSPLHVSIHTTDDQLRRRMLGNRRAPAIMDQLRRLTDLGLEIHGQIVLCRGINDGLALESTLTDLLDLARPLASLAIVPVGVTRWSGPGIEGYDREGALAILAAIEQWQSRFAAAGGGLWAADEWYLKAGRPLPAWSTYGSFPQIDNGVGMARDFVHAFRLATRRLPSRIEPARRVALATGTLFAPVLRELVTDRLSAIQGLAVDVIACANELFGGGVTVAGLLGGRDIVRDVQASVKRGFGPEEIILPATILRDAGDLTLDDMSIDEISTELGVPVVVLDTPKQLVDEILGRRMAGKGARHR